MLIFFINYLQAENYYESSNNYVSGVFRGSNRLLNVNIRFLENLKGELEILSRDNAVIATLRRGEIHFQSNLIVSTKNFQMEFKPLLERTIHSLNTNPTGEFITFLNDIKET